MIRLGLQIPNFDFPDVPPEALFGRVADMAGQAERSGFDTVLVMDHFYQLPMLGSPESNMLECYTLLGALAARTERVRLSTLVTGNTYRNPALVAKIVTTLDVISGGRALCGIGAGWFEPEHVGYGFAFPPLGERLSRLEESLEIISRMLRCERPSFEGRFYRVSDAINSPAPLQPGGPRILIGGGGEKRTLRLVAKYGHESNLTCSPDEFPRKLEALDRHCKDLGRERSEINVTWMGSLVLGRTQEQAEAARNAFLARRGMRWDALPEAVQERVNSALVLGDPDRVGEFVQRRILEPGLDGVIFNLPANGHDLEAIALAGETLRKVMS